VQPLTTLTRAPSSDLRIWANGRLLDDPAETLVRANDHGLVVGDGVFEALPVNAAGAFALTRHLRRLDRSAAAMNLPAPDHDLIAEAVTAVLHGRRYSRGKLRITYTGGEGPLGSQAAYGPPTLIVAADPVDPPAISTSIVTAPWSRNEHGALTGVKSTSYGENVRSLAYAAARGAGEAIFLNTAGQLCEGTGTNIFVVLGDRVVTPPLSSGPLAGITRELILEWCNVEERDLTLAEAQAADEVFVTSSLRNVQSVDRWDGTVFGDHRPMTAQISSTFLARAAADLDP
jgi:branched-chain amino acid aminotransferase